MGRMSALHSADATTPSVCVPPASRNGGSSNADVNGTAIDLRGKRGVLFTLSTGAMTGAAAVAARLQTGDNPDDAANANWTNVNSTTYPTAAISNKTNANSVFEMAFDAKLGNQVRAVLTPEANVSLAAITAVTY